MKKIIMTGGGTAGHVTPNMALIERLRDEDFEISYIGSYSGIEKGLIEGMGIPYYGISSGKLRRYFDVKNFSDPFRVLKGMREAKKLMKELKPDIVFSKGGFVAVPVVFAAHKYKIPVIIHESDMTPGLANKLCIPKADKICCNFKETLDFLPEDKAVHTGTPLRKALFEGSREAGLKFCGFDGSKPVIMVVGGSTGAAAINEAVRNLLPTLLTRFNVVHLCGKGKNDPAYDGTEGYRQFEYISTELKDLFAISDLVISRAGANAVCELLALAKPNILIPLSAAASRGDQILNAESFERLGYSYVLEEEKLTNETLLESIEKVYNERYKYYAAMKAATQADATGVIVKMIKELAGLS
ncbi:MAG: undecaprenyldiphospho-muramoylpentapeptide beta-N-acetylglucosaminyltransferase [Lachnospiraceae bacterium]|nr:undecaprenyldiphospho-muramoylpentapeptide beta-N-acetylglucosaminyltransferase [Lachnospiraceae bacterium]